MSIVTGMQNHINQQDGPLERTGRADHDAEITDGSAFVLHGEGSSTMPTSMLAGCRFPAFESRSVPGDISPANVVPLRREDVVGVEGLKCSKDGVYGQCRPCGFLWKSGGCRNGWQCNHCHLCPMPTKKDRRKRNAVAQEGQQTSLWQDAPALSFGVPPGLSLRPNPEPETQHIQTGSQNANLLEAVCEVDGEQGAEIVAFASVGSTNHPFACQPCSWFWKPGSCQNGAECFHCHMCPPGELKARRKFRTQQLRATACLEQRSSFLQHLHAQKDVERTLSFLGLATATDNVELGDGAVAGKVPMEPLPLERIHSVSTAAGSSVDLDESDDATSTWSVLDDEIRDVVSSGVSDKTCNEYVAAIEAHPTLDCLPMSTDGDGCPSVGSATHGSDCRPCAWFWKPSGCHHGRECLHCHSCPQGELKSRRKAKVQMLQAADVPKNRSLSITTARARATPC